MLETNEEIQEKRRHVREIETKLNSVMKDTAAKSESIAELTSQLQEHKSQFEEAQNLAHQTEQERSLQSSNAIATLEASLAEAREALEAEKLARRADIEQLNASNEHILKERAVTAESLKSECARLEAELAALRLKSEATEKELVDFAEKLEIAERDKAEKLRECAEIKEQVSAMEELTVSMTKQSQDKESEIASLRNSLTDKDLEMAKTLRETDQTSS